MEIQATIAAANVLFHTAGEHVESVHAIAGVMYFGCAASAIPALEEAGGVWAAWHDRTCDARQQRDLTLRVEGVEFVVYETREAP